jgi:hypothetical protein
MRFQTWRASRSGGKNFQEMQKRISVMVEKVIASIPELSNSPTNIAAHLDQIERNPSVSINIEELHVEVCTLGYRY